MHSKSLLAILSYNSSRINNVKNLLISLISYDNQNILVCASNELLNEYNKINTAAINYIDCTGTNRPQAKNKIIKYAKDNGYSKVHIFEDDVIIYDTTFIKKVEVMMDTIGFPYIFNHLSNIQNYAVGVLAPRLHISNITNELSLVDFYPFEGKEYICIDIDKTMDNLLYYDESLNYCYHYHNIWRRRNIHKSQMPFLNFYPFIQHEGKYLTRLNTIPSTVTTDIAALARKEMESINLKWETDVSIDEVLDYIACYIKGEK